MSTPRICTACGHIGQPTTVTKGHLLIEVALWLMMLVPGIIYSIWRLTSRHQACEMCGGTALIPADSPVGKQLLAARGIAEPPAPAPSVAHVVGYTAGKALARKTGAPPSKHKVIPFGEFK